MTWRSRTACFLLGVFLGAALFVTAGVGVGTHPVDPHRSLMVVWVAKWDCRATADCTSR